jgi:alpha-mannosidase
VCACITVINCIAHHVLFSVVAEAALLSAEAGMHGLFFGRIDYQDRAIRRDEQRAEFVWRASPSLGRDAQVFAGLTGSYDGNYGPPRGFNWHVTANDPFIEDNENLSTYNVPARLRDFYAMAGKQVNESRGRHIMFTMGE